MNKDIVYSNLNFYENLKFVNDTYQKEYYIYIDSDRIYHLLPRTRFFYYKPSLTNICENFDLTIKNYVVDIKSENSEIFTRDNVERINTCTKNLQEYKENQYEKDEDENVFLQVVDNTNNYYTELINVINQKEQEKKEQEKKEEENKLISDVSLTEEVKDNEEDTIETSTVSRKIEFKWDLDYFLFLYESAIDGLIFFGNYISNLTVTYAYKITSYFKKKE
jgi:hypothetical protein